MTIWFDISQYGVRTWVDPQNPKGRIRIWTVWIYSRRVLCSRSLKKHLNGFAWVYLAEWQDRKQSKEALHILALSGAFGAKRKTAKKFQVSWWISRMMQIFLEGLGDVWHAQNGIYLGNVIFMYIPLVKGQKLPGSYCRSGPQTRSDSFENCHNWPTSVERLTTGADKWPMLQFQHEVLGHHPFNWISENRHNAATPLSLGKLLGIVVFLSAFLWNMQPLSKKQIGCV